MCFVVSIIYNTSKEEKKTRYEMMIGKSSIVLNCIKSKLIFQQRLYRFCFFSRFYLDASHSNWKKRNFKMFITRLETPNNVSLICL